LHINYEMKFVTMLALTPFVLVFSTLVPIVAVIAAMRPAEFSSVISPFDEHPVNFCWIELANDEAQIEHLPLARRNGAERHGQTGWVLEMCA
jgi:hypothetical protein